MAVSNVPLGGPLPSARLASFQNQGVTGAINNGMTQAAALSPTQTALAQAARPQTAVQLSAQRRTDAVKSSGVRLTQIAQAGAARRAQNQAMKGAYDTQAGKNVQGGGGHVAINMGTGASAARQSAINDALSYVNAKTPYVLGGTSKKGIDCSGLVMMVYNKLGYNINRHSSRWQGKNIPGVRTSVANLRPGDIVAWKDGSHIAIYAGNGNIIEAAKPGTAVRTHKLWSNAVYGIALRLPGE